MNLGYLLDVIKLLENVIKVCIWWIVGWFNKLINENNFSSLCNHYY